MELAEKTSSCLPARGEDVGATSDTEASGSQGDNSHLTLDLELGETARDITMMFLALSFPQSLWKFPLDDTIISIASQMHTLRNKYFTL